MIDAASGGSISEMEPEEGKTLISKMTANSRQYGQEEDIPRNANEVSIASLDYKISQLTAAIQQLAAGNNARTCEGEQQVNAIGGFKGQQRKYDPFSSTYNSGWRRSFSSTYNPGWRDHPNLSYRNRQQNYEPRTNYQVAKSGMSLEDIVQSLANSTLAFQQETKSSIQNLENQMSQLATSVSKLESQGKLSSQTIPNPKQNVSAITLRSGKQLESASPKRFAQRSATDLKEEAEIEILVENEPKKSEVEQPPMQVICPPFPERFAQSKREKEEKEIFEIYCKIQVNIPDAECPLKQTGVTLQLADRSIVYPKGLLEDVFVQVGKLIFPADFFVLDMEYDNSFNSTDLLLGRPFLSTTKTKIDVHEGTLLMDIDVVDPLAQKAFELSKRDKLGVVLTENLIMDYPNNSTLKLDEEIIETIRSLDTLSHKAPEL
ncbi:uncharacterized protein LOC122723696 [Manihot esculenta]|uniref:uncharacterized protein LOC122723696 n=1 Tax=Manihot esculenta TaxID=3983 RepID=UPI001CC559F9|nr:uncharacterized protein LOC122723696 [Manihot esculenta]